MQKELPPIASLDLFRACMTGDHARSLSR
jgi:hypothetical protein